MSDYDRLAELQLRQGIAMEDPSEILNDVAFQTHSKSSSAVVSPTKKKRNESAAVVVFPTKRVKSSKSRDASKQEATTPTKPAPKKLARPNKAQQRHIISTYPVVKKSKGDIYEPEEASPEKVQRKQIGKKQVHNPEMMPKGKRGKPPANASVSEAPRVRKEPQHDVSTAEGPASAVFNGRIDLHGNPRRTRGRPKTKGTPTETGEPTEKGHRTTQSSRPPPAIEQASSTSPQTPEDTAHIQPINQETKAKTPRQSPRDKVGDLEDNNDSGNEDGGDSIEAPSGQGELQEDSESEESVHDEESQMEEGDEAVEEHMDLLGQEMQWDKVLEAARSVDKIQFATRTIRELVSKIKEAKSFYKRLLHPGEMDRSELVEHLSESLEEIEERIGDIAEENEPGKRPGMAKDMYSRAIPEMVLLLESALRLRTSQSPGLHDYSTLKEIVRLQDMTIKLCQKARGWKIKPNTSRPIIKPTRFVILPFIRDMRDKPFADKLRELKKTEKAKENARKFAQSEIVPSQPELETIWQRKNRSDPDWYNKYTQEELEGYKRKGVAQTVRDPQIRNVHPVKQKPAKTSHEWTPEQYGELVVELGNEETRDLPPEERYSAALNNKAFQNMLPEHIREKAVALKADLMKIYPAPWSSKSKAPAASNEKAAKVNVLATASKRSSLDATTKEEDMTQGFDADGFSKTSRVRASKKPLTVAKAPKFGRSTSSKPDQQPTTTKENVRPTLEKRSARPPSLQSAKAATPARSLETGTPTQQASSVARTKAPVLSSRARTPTQAVANSRAGTPAGGRPAIRSPKTAGTTNGHANAAKSQVKARFPTPEVDKNPEPKALKDAESMSEVTNYADIAEIRLPVEESSLLSNPRGISGHERPPSDENVERLEVYTGGDEEKGTERTDGETDEKVNREIALRNKIIQDLRYQLQKTESTHERKVEELESTAEAQAKSLRLELDGVRGMLVDLENTHRSTLEKHDSLLRSRDKIIQNLSEEAEELRSKLEANDQNTAQVAPDHGGGVHNIVPEKGSASQSQLLHSKDEEIRLLSETVQDLRKQLEAADTARAKEIYDELLRSKDKEIASVSGVVQNLRGELDKPSQHKNHQHHLQSKDKEIKSLSETVKSLQEKLEANDKAREHSLRGEFQELQNKHKRKIEDLEAAAVVRVGAVQSEYDELLRLRDREIKDMAGVAQELQKEIELARENQRQQVQNAELKCEQQAKDAIARLESELRNATVDHKKELRAIQVARGETDSKHASDIQEMTRKHKHDLETARSEQQTTEMNYQQELREVRRKYDKGLENIRTEVETEFHDEITRLEREIEDISARTDQEIERAETKHREEIERITRDREQVLTDMGLQHQRDLEEASSKYQKELADVERLRGEGSEEVSQKHEKQLDTIAAKYQQELDAANQKINDIISRHEQQLAETKADHQAIALQADKYRDELEEAREKHETVYREKRSQEEKLLELSSMHDKELSTAATKHQEDIDQAIAINNELSEKLEKEEQARQEKVNVMEQEIEHLRSTSTTAAAEAASLKASLEELELARSEVEENAKLTYQQELRDVDSKHEHELGQLRTELTAAAAEIVSLKKTLEESDAQRSLADEDAASKHKQTLQDIASEHDQVMLRLRSERDASLAEMVAVQASLQDLNWEGSEELATLKNVLKETETARDEASAEAALLHDQVVVAGGENEQYLGKINVLQSDLEALENQLANSKKNIRCEKEEAEVEIALQKDKLELANRENAQYKRTLTALKTNIEALRTQLTESSEDLNRERTEAAVEIALLKEKLELSELQKQSSSEDMSLSRNEANVEIALLRDKLELSDLQTQSDKKTISALEKQLRELQAQPLDTSPFTHHQLREELAMLARHHAANLEDIEALKASVLAERGLREEGWRRRAEGRHQMTKELQGIGAELYGITGVH